MMLAVCLRATNIYILHSPTPGMHACYVYNAQLTTAYSQLAIFIIQLWFPDYFGY